MRVVAVAGLLAWTLSAAAGCTQSPYLLQSQNQSLQQKQASLETRNRELESRASTLDQDNQELHTQVAQARQQSKLLEDQLAAVRDQLSTATAQLAQAKGEKQLTDKQVEALAAAAKRRGGATITANSSFQKNLPAVSLPGIEVRADGDVVRIELPAAKLFQPGGVTLQPTAASLIDSVVAEVARTYPEQLIGVEGHTDSDGVRGGSPATTQQLSVSRAMAVYQHLTTRGKLQPAQLFVVGHGGNHPVVSNGTPSGRDRNNRVELVIYPEKRR